jgi:type VI protein secretion system component VasK
MFVLLVWVLCSFGCYKLAENNNRDKTLWAVLGLIFGIFALLVLALMGRADSETDRQIFDMTKSKFIDLYEGNEEVAKENPVTLRTYLMLKNGEKVKLDQLTQSMTTLQSIVR